MYIVIEESLLINKGMKAKNSAVEVFISRAGNNIFFTDKDDAIMITLTAEELRSVWRGLDIESDFG
jgi:hypothetical protein